LSYAADRIEKDKTDRQTVNILPTPTDFVGMGNNNILKCRNVVNFRAVAY